MREAPARPPLRAALELERRAEGRCGRGRGAGVGAGEGREAGGGGAEPPPLEVLPGGDGQTARPEEGARAALHEELAVRVHVIGVRALPALALAEEQGDDAAAGELRPVRGAVGAEEVLGAVVLVALARSVARVVHVEVVRVPQGDLPQHPALAGRHIPQAQPLRIPVEALGGDGRRVARVPPPILLRGAPVELRVPVQRIPHQHVPRGARDVGRQPEGLEEAVDLRHLGLQRLGDGEVGQVPVSRPRGDVDAEDDVAGPHRLAQLEEGEPPAGHGVGQAAQLGQPRGRHGRVGVGVVLRLLLQQAEAVRLHEHQHGLAELLGPLHEHLEVGEVAPHGAGVLDLGEELVLAASGLTVHLVVLDGGQEALGLALLQVLQAPLAVARRPSPSCRASP